MTRTSRTRVWFFQYYSSTRTDCDSDLVTGKKKRATLGNPVATDADGLLIDVDVQLVDNDPSTLLTTREDKSQDVNHFFCPAVVKEVNGKLKKYRVCKLCPCVLAWIFSCHLCSLMLDR